MKKFLFWILVTAFISIPGFAQKTPGGKIDSLKLALQKAKPDTSKASILYSLGRAYRTENLDSSIYFFKECISFSQQFKFTEFEIKGLLWLGGTFRNKAEYLAATQQWQKAIDLSEKLRDTLSLIDALDNFTAFTYYWTRDTNNVKLFKRIESLARSKRDTSRLCTALANIGNSYVQRQLWDPDTAHLVLQRLDSAEMYLREAISMDTSRFFGYLRMGSSKLFRKDYDSALYYFRIAKSKPSIRNNDEYTRGLLSACYFQIAEIFRENKQYDYDSSFYYARQSFEIASKVTDSAAWLLDPSTILARLYEDQKNYKEAYYYMALSKKLTDNKLADEKKQGLIKILFQQEQQERDKERVRKEYQSRVRFYILLSATAVLLLIAFLLYRNNRQKQKAKTKIEKAYHQLKETQAQLVQQEKMASLGELTAGIAHEIQNPLNFVNNFSEVNNELIEELKSQKSKLKIEEQDEILNDIFQNNEKINHHGKRADAIVKGMLQHSRSSSGQKEPTNINDLADEYLRLAYHGLRAKDKSFNATFKTDLDNGIGKINIVAQDIGRVILNLINNAFYAVSEKQKQNISGYEPVVTVSSKKINNKIELRVIDNGNGVPQKVLDKIFQPFFTTKPTGEGTGLGLSLSYDIITKGHGGELKVETKEGEGAEFIIQLPNT